MTMAASTARKSGPRRFPALVVGLAAVMGLVLPSCSRMVSNAAGDLADNLAQAIADSDDPATVKAGAPAYLLMMDGMVRRDPDNVALLTQAATLYSTYSAAFVDDPERARRLARRALDYATRALCARKADDCGLRTTDFETFTARIAQAPASDVPLLFAWGAAWAGWIKAHADDFDALAELARVEAIMQRVVVLDEGYRQGGAHLYLGTFNTLMPPALGGRPETARAHFERAIAISAGRNLMAKVVFARQYARMVYDRPLHDRLLNAVLAADPAVPGMVLQNTMAQDQARALLASADDYF